MFAGIIRSAEGKPWKVLHGIEIRGDHFWEVAGFCLALGTESVSLKLQSNKLTQGLGCRVLFGAVIK